MTIIDSGIWGYRSSNTSIWRKVNTQNFADINALNSITVDYPTRNTWYGDGVEVGGRNDSIGTEWEDISTFDADNNYLGGNAVSSMTISSNAVGDKYNAYGSGTAGATFSGGARIVRVHYLDANWDAQTQDVYMSGNLPVTLTTDILIPNRLEVVDTGISSQAAGDIVLNCGTDHYLKIEAECNESYNGVYTVPNGKNLIITDAFCYPQVDSEGSVEFVYKVQQPYVVGATTNYIEGYKWAGSFISGAGMSMAPNMTTPMIVKEKCRIRIRGKAAVAGAKATGYFKGYLVDEK